MKPRSPYSPTLDFEWVTAALEAIVELEHGRTQQAELRAMAREIVAICRDARQRVARAEQFLDAYRHVLPPGKKNEILRLMAETLLFIQYGGRRVKITDDPSVILGG